MEGIEVSSSIRRKSHSPASLSKLQTSVVIDTDYIGTCRFRFSNHRITANVGLFYSKQIFLFKVNGAIFQLFVARTIYISMR